MLGLAIYNSILLDVRFPIAVYKKLMGKKCGLKDLKEIEPELFTTLSNISNEKGDVSDYGLTMSISYDNFGLEETHELVENGKNIALTNENKDQFVELYLDWYFNKSIERQYTPFKKGFYKVMTEQSMQVSHLSQI